MSAERKNWDKGEWAEKARQRDAEAAKHAKARDQAMKEGEYSHDPLFSLRSLARAS